MMLGHLTAHDEFLFNVMLIPGCALIIWGGVEGIRHRRLGRRRGRQPIEGPTAVILGIAIVLAGCVEAVMAVRGLLR